MKRLVCEVAGFGGEYAIHIRVYPDEEELLQRVKEQRDTLEKRDPGAQNGSKAEQQSNEELDGINDGIHPRLEESLSQREHTVELRVTPLVTMQCGMVLVSHRFRL